VSAENVELVRRWLRAISTSSTPDAGAGFWAADADYYPVRGFPESRPCHGVQQIVQFNLTFREAWSRYERAVRELIEVGDDRVLACTTLRADGRESGVRLESDLYSCVWLRDGLFSRVEDHLTLAGALRALGLEGETLEAAGLGR
jgi:ketosteroid isomerase-like protein